MPPRSAPPALVALYVPGDRPDRFNKAVRACTGTGFVIIDLEDAVTPEHKAAARAAAAEFVAVEHAAPVAVRVNGAETPWQADDLEALRQASCLAAIRVPKVESVRDVAGVRSRLPDIAVQAIVESAVGVENLASIAAAHGVSAIGLGEADLRSDLEISAIDGLEWVRSRLVIAARAAGLPSPMMSVFTHLSDLDGLRDSCADGRAHGFVGRAAIHPRQISVIVDAFRPTSEEAALAREILAALDAARDAGRGVAVLPTGRMIDPAMRCGAQRTVDFADKYGVSSGSTTQKLSNKEQP